MSRSPGIGLQRRWGARGIPPISGASGSLWTPANDADIVFWLDFSDPLYYTLVSSRYSAMVDKSGNGHSYSQSDSAKRPYQRTLNGLDAGDFRLAQALLSDATIDMTSLSTSSCMAVFQGDSVSSFSIIWEQSPTNNTNVDAWRFCTNASVINGGIKQVSGVNSAQKQEWNTATIANGETHCATFAHARARNPDEIYGYLDGASSGSRSLNTNDTGAYTGNNYTNYVGARGGTSFFYDGALGELIVTSADLFDDDALRANYNNYLTSKWSL